jgi:hypothetical protein
MVDAWQWLMLALSLQLAFVTCMYVAPREINFFFKLRVYTSVQKSDRVLVGHRNADFRVGTNTST